MADPLTVKKSKGEDAARLMNSAVLKEWWEKTEKALLAELIDTEYNEPEKREHIHRMLKCLSRLHHSLHMFIVDGKFAAEEITKRERESLRKRFTRKIG